MARSATPGCGGIDGGSMLIPGFPQVRCKNRKNRKDRMRPSPLAICACACLHSGSVKTFGYPRQRRF
jgi:hypothetical protein